MERRFISEILKLQKQELIPKALVNSLKPTASNIPKFYGLPKIHKPDVPLPSIVSSIGSPTYKLAKYINTLITPLVGLTPSYVKDSKHFVDDIKTVQIQPNEVMVNFDIKSLFLNVPVDEALEVILQRLTEDETLEDRTALTPEQVTHLLELCLKTTYFSFREEFYQQTDGAAVGSPVSPVVANLCMEMFEEMALSMVQPKPSIWRRYVDDIFLFSGGETRG